MKWLLIGLVGLPLVSGAQLKLADIFSDNMVLQRGEPIHFLGKGLPGDLITVSFANGIKTTDVKPDSSWSLFFPSQKANHDPQTVRIQARQQQIELKNVLIGDVWICSGQSNMEWPMYREMHWKAEKENAARPLIRFTNPPPAGRYVYGVPYTDSLNNRLTPDRFYLWNGWETCDSNTVKQMSAIGYYFAKAVSDAENVPVGLINLSIGGAPIETFISRKSLADHPRFAGKVKGDWLKNNHLPEWIRERGRQNVGSNPQGYRDELGLNHAYKPGLAYAAGIEPLFPMPVKGVIWYQGESNSLEKERMEEYRELMHLLINDYRTGWKQPAMPFYWVQLSSIDTTNYQSHYWPAFRDQQRILLSEVKNGGMAVSSDIGFRNDVHPTNKKDVGERLARWALNKTYQRNIVPSGPLPLKAKYKKGKVIVRFQYTADGLKTGDATTLRAFSVDGKNDTPASIVDNKVHIPTDEKPDYLYYGWKPYSDGNLVNSENLPASTFKIKVK